MKGVCSTSFWTHFLWRDTKVNTFLLMSLLIWIQLTWCRRSCVNHCIWTHPQLELDTVVGKLEACRSWSGGPTFCRESLTHTLLYRGVPWIPGSGFYFFPFVFGNIHLISSLGLVLISVLHMALTLSFSNLALIHICGVDTHMWCWYTLECLFF